MKDQRINLLKALFGVLLLVLASTSPEGTAIEDEALAFEADQQFIICSGVMRMANPVSVAEAASENPDSLCEKLFEKL